MPNCFIPDLTNEKDVYEITDEEFHYLKNVLRIKGDEKIIGFNGIDFIAEFEVKKILKKSIILRLKKIEKFKKNYLISLAIPVIKHKNFNFILKSIQQLGVKKIFPFISQNSVINKIDKRKIEKWNKILIESAKQSNNFYIPWIEKVYNLDEIVNLGFPQKILLFEKGKNELKNINKTETLVIIGPEGSFTEEEINILKNNGFSDIKLKTNILRSEISTLTVLSILKFLVGEI